MTDAHAPVTDAPVSNSVPLRPLSHSALTSTALQVTDFCTGVFIAWVTSVLWDQSFLFVAGSGIAIIQMLSCKRMGYYSRRNISSNWQRFKVLLKASFFSLASVMTALFMLQRTSPTPTALMIVAVGSGAWIFWGHNCPIFDSASPSAPTQNKNCLIIGWTDIGRALAEVIHKDPNCGCDFVGFLDDNARDPYILGTTADLERIIRAHFVEQIFIATYSNRDLVKALTFRAPSLGVDVSMVPDLFDGIGWNAPLDSVGHFPILVLHRSQDFALQRALKRLFDILGSIVGLILLAPLFAIAAGCIKLDSPGPVLYLSRRVGRRGTIFNCYKFRSMQDGADELLPSLSPWNERSGPLFKMRQDPRVTKVGKWIRKYSIDELPQLLNVLRGEMSLVGPRPPSVEEYRLFTVQHLRKLEVTPGITGLWQVTSRSDPSFQSYIRCDLEYIENWSLWFDLEILAWTAIEVLRGSGV